MRRASVLSGVVFVLLAVGACGSPADPVSTGTLCAPAKPNCPSQTRLERSAEGRNLLDIAIENPGPKATATFDVSFELAGDAAVSDLGDTAADTGPPQRAGVFPADYRIPSGGRVEDRFRSTEIFSLPELFVQLDCTSCADCTEACEVRADYVYQTESRECSSDNECSGDNLCDESAGLCVECLSDDDCGLDQTCEESSGRCRPPEGGGCRHADRSPPLPWAISVLWVLLWRRRALRGARSLLPLVGLLAFLVLTTPSQSRAASPGSTLSAGVGPRWVAGSLGRDVRRGVGLELHETLRWRHGGMSAWVTANYFVTEQTPPPHVNELQLFGFGIGPRAFYGIGPVELMAGAGYQRLGFAPNALVRQTDNESNFNAIGGTFGAGYRWSRFVFRVDGGVYPILELDGSIISATVSFGVSTR